MATWDVTLRALEIGWVLLVGATIGSFLNVVIARVPHGVSIVRPGSRCPRCGTPIGWRDNVPILSWLLLRARCRSCRASISPRYPLVEALGALAALAAWHRHGLAPAAAAELAFAAAVIALAFIDIDTWLLPNAITWPLIAAGLVVAVVGIRPTPTLASAVTGATAGFAAFAALSKGAEWLLKKEALGFGDVWLLAGIGAWLGGRALLPVVLLASVQGSVVGIALLLLGRDEQGAAPDPHAGQRDAAAVAGEEEDWVPPRHAVPFGPFLAAGALEWLFAADRLTALVPALDVFR